MRNLEPPPSSVELVTSVYDVTEKSTVDKFSQDSIWKKWLNNLYEKVELLLASRNNHVSVENANFGKGTTAPSQVIIGDYNGWEFTIGDDAVMTVELSHEVDADNDIEVHFTYVINEAYATNNGEVQFQVDYSLVPNGGGEVITAPGSSGTLVTGDINIPTVAYEAAHVITMVIPAADYSNGDLIGLTFSRIAIDAGNNPTAHPVVLGLHLEYTAKTINWYGE